MSAGPRRARLEAFLSELWRGRGIGACALRPLSWLYGSAMAARQAAYRRGWRRTIASPVPVIVVGNRVVGGAGKTPTVLAVVEHLRSGGWQPGIVSRGHGRSTVATRLVGPNSAPAEVGDEPLLLHRRSGVPVVVGRRRSDAAAELLRHHPEVDVLVADDGLQHLAWSRDIEIVVFDARGTGNGWLLPSGPLREAIDTPARGARLLHLYTHGVRSTPLAGFMADRSLLGIVGLEDWHRDPATPRRPFAALGTAPVHACAGIAHPERFFEMLRTAGLRPITHPLADHTDYAELPWPDSASDVLVTEKDAIKLDPARLAVERPATQVWVAPLDFLIEPMFWTALDEALAAAAIRHPSPVKRKPDTPKE